MTLDEIDGEIYIARKQRTKWLTITVDELEKLVRLARRAEPVKVIQEANETTGNADDGLGKRRNPDTE